MATRQIRLTVEYDGTGLAGWQRQANAPTVQEHLETALAALQARYEEELVARGGALVRAVTSDDPVAVLRRLLRSVGGGPGPA